MSRDDGGRGAPWDSSAAALTTSRIGGWAAVGVSLVGVAYALALGAGFSIYGLRKPIVDPLLAVMEALTLVSACLLLVMMAAIHARAPLERRTFGLVSLAFMTLATGATSAVHFVELTAGRQLGPGSLVWPSRAYALELLAWDMLLGLSLVFAALTFTGEGRERRVRRGLRLCGTLCLAGVAGPVTGNMRLQFIGVFGYAVALPITCAMLARMFRDEARDCRTVSGSTHPAPVCVHPETRHSRESGNPLGPREHGFPRARE
jgi:hypothetical protein